MGQVKLYSEIILKDYMSFEELTLHVSSLLNSPAVQIVTRDWWIWYYNCLESVIKYLSVLFKVDRNSKLHNTLGLLNSYTRPNNEYYKEHFDKYLQSGLGYSTFLQSRFRKIFSIDYVKLRYDYDITPLIDGIHHEDALNILYGVFMYVRLLREDITSVSYPFDYRELKVDGSSYGVVYEY